MMASQSTQSSGSTIVGFHLDEDGGCLGAYEIKKGEKRPNPPQIFDLTMASDHEDTIFVNSASDGCDSSVEELYYSSEDSLTIMLPIKVRRRYVLG